ncbi:flagellar biosynthetic protein FliR [bacterium]|nr:flagellar biosynthetic protein FliR [bacterium]
MSALYPTTDFGALTILLVFFRLLGLFLLVPGFSHNSIPGQVKVLLALSVALAISPIVKPFVPVLDGTMTGYAVAVTRETAIGLLMGFVAYVTFEAISLGAHFLGYQMGLGTAAMMDPASHNQVSLLVPMQAWIALLVFFIADLHHHVLQVFVESFRATQHMGAESFQNVALLKFFIGLTAKLFALAVTLSAPITLLVLCTNVVIGMVSRMIPQMNIMLFSFPITITLGFLGLYIVAPEMLDSIENILGEVSGELMTLIRVL